MIWRELPKRVCPTCKGDIAIVGVRCNHEAEILVAYRCEKCMMALEQSFSMLGLKEYCDNLNLEALRGCNALPCADETEFAQDNVFLKSMHIKPEIVRRR